MNRSRHAAQRSEHKDLFHHANVSAVSSGLNRNVRELCVYHRSSYDPVVCPYLADDPESNPQSQDHGNGCDSSTRTEDSKALRTSVQVLKGHVVVFFRNNELRR